MTVKGDAYKRRLAKKRLLLAKDRITLINALGGVCVFCGEHDHHVLDIDHIRHDGNLIRRNGGSKSIVTRIKADSKGFTEIDRSRYQLLCKNCNWRKEKLRRSKNG